MWTAPISAVNGRSLRRIIFGQFSIAVDRIYKGNKETDWINLNFWGKTAQIAADYVKKGDQIAVTGSLRIESWEDKESRQTRTKAVVVVDRLKLLGSRNPKEADTEEAPF